MNEALPVRKQRARAADVARLAGVSQSAVSRTFTLGGSVSDEVRARVLKAAKRLGYRPNAMARAMASRRSNVIGVIEAIDTNLQYPEVLSELSRAITRRGMRVMLFTVDRMTEVEQVVDQIWSYQVDGVVAMLGLEDGHVRLLEEHGVPVVLFNRTPKNYQVSAVTCDHLGAGAALAERLLTAGHSRFAFIDGPEASTVAIERLAAVRRCVAAAGRIEVASARGDFSYLSGQTAMATILAAKVDASVVVAASDMMALGAMDHARFSAGLSVPGDIAVAGFDGIGAGRFDSFSLTTVRQPITPMAEAAMSILCDRIADPSRLPELRILPGAIVDGLTA